MLSCHSVLSSIVENSTEPQESSPIQTALYSRGSVSGVSTIVVLSLPLMISSSAFLSNVQVVIRDIACVVMDNGIIPWIDRFMGGSARDPPQNTGEQNPLENDQNPDLRIYLT